VGRIPDLDAAFLAATPIVGDLTRRPEVARLWTRPSALPQMSIGALACHLGRQTVRAAELLPVPTRAQPLDSADAHYRHAAWVTSTSPDDPENDRSLDDAEAARGPDALQQRMAASADQVRRLLVDGSASEVVWIPWQGWALTRRDFLLTRLVEIVVHCDDLAVSVDVPTPVFPAEVFTPVSELLLRLAVLRHGQSAVIGTLTRTERSRVVAAF
jgi:hypothetical protein